MKKMRSMYPMVPMGPVRRPTVPSSSASGHSKRMKTQIRTTHRHLSPARSRPPRADRITGEVAEGTRSLLDPPHHDRGVAAMTAEGTACNGADEPPKAKFMVENQHCRAAHLLVGHQARFGLMLLHIWRRR
jgi:hypothetical protein